MSKTLKLVFIALLVNATTLLAQEQPKYSKDVEARIQQVENGLGTWYQTQNVKTFTLADRMKYYGLKGVSIAVVHNYKIEWARAYGWADSAEQRRVTPQTLFQAASISKSLNGVGVLKLVQDKHLDLYADINNYLTSWKFPYDTLSKGKKISIVNLLSHTGGLTVHGFPGYATTDPIPTLLQVLDGVKPANTAKVRSMYEPGLKSEYSGGGTTISQLIITDQTHQAYDEYMWQSVLKPLGMVSSTYTQPPAASKNKLLATAYRANGKEIKGKYHIYPEQAPAGLWTNPTDLGKYIIETQLSYDGKSSKVLTPANTRLRLTPYIDKSAALGVFITEIGGQKYFQHGGANEGFRCQYWGSLEGGDGVVVMINSDDGGILTEIVNSVATVYNWKDFYKPVMKTIVQLPDSLTDRYVGKYAKGNRSFRFFKKDGKLWFKQGGFETPFYFTSPTDCFINEDDASFKFGMDADGKTLTFSIGPDNVFKKVS